MQLNFEAEAKSLTQMPKGPEAKAEAKLLASRPAGPRGVNISGKFVYTTELAIITTTLFAVMSTTVCRRLFSFDILHGAINKAFIYSSMDILL